MDNKEIKTITIRQGSDDDALEMTVQVTQEELEKMEELRSKNPQKWPTYSLELIKEAREALAKPSKYKSKKPQSNKSKRKWLWIVLAFILAAIGIALWLFTRNTSVVQGNDLAFRQFKGPVKTVYTLEFDAINAFGEGVVLDKPSADNATIRCFDSMGNQTAYKTIRINNSYPSQTETQNSQGLPLKVLIYGHHSHDCTGYFYYEYNDRGEKIRSTRGSYLGINFLDSESTKTYSYKYDTHGRIVLMKSHDSDGAVAEVAQTQYDGLGRITKYVYTNYDFFLHQEDYEYSENGFTKRSVSYFENEVEDSSSEQWLTDRSNRRNDKYVYDEKGAYAGKISYYYDRDSIYYKIEYWDADGNPQESIYNHGILTPNDSVFFSIWQNEYSCGFYSVFSSPAISFKRPVANGFEKKSFDIESELASSMTGVFDDPFHRLVTRNDGATLSMDYDKKRNPKSAIHTFDDGETIITNYSYNGRKNNWKRIETSKYSNGKKETTTNTYSGYNLLSSIESNGHEEYWEYNEQGEEVSYRELKGGVITTNIKYSDYVYDKYDNWIRRTNYNVSNGAYTITERCIEYY